jgi:aconitate hydratase
MDKEPLGVDARTGSPVFLKEIWPSKSEIEKLIHETITPTLYRERYKHILNDNPMWGEIQTVKGNQYHWDPKSTYIQNPPYFDDFHAELPPKKELKDMRCLALFGDSVTTDHISPAGAFSSNVPAGKYLLSLGIKEADFNSYGSRRGNHEVMMRGTFANVRIKNKMAGGKEGGFTAHMSDGKIMPIFDACEQYAEEKVPLIVFAGQDYGMGSSRDWAAKGTALLGVRAVVARSFERIHRSNLIGMGVLPLEFLNDESHESLGITGEEIFSITGLKGALVPHQEVTLEISKNGNVRHTKLRLRIDTAIEVEYYQHGGIMPYVLRQTLSHASR